MTMKIKKKSPDGTETEIEGSAEELAEYDRKRKQGSEKQNEQSSSGKKRILNEQVLAELTAIRQAIQALAPLYYYPFFTQPVRLTTPWAPGQEFPVIITDTQTDTTPFKQYMME